MEQLDKKAFAQAHHAWRTARLHGDNDRVCLAVAIRAYVENAHITMDGGGP